MTFLSLQSYLNAKIIFHSLSSLEFCLLLSTFFPYQGLVVSCFILKTVDQRQMSKYAWNITRIFI